MSDHMVTVSIADPLSCKLVMVLSFRSVLGYTVGAHEAQAC